MCRVIVPFDPEKFMISSIWVRTTFWHTCMQSYSVWKTAHVYYNYVFVTIFPQNPRIKELRGASGSWSFVCPSIRTVKIHQQHPYHIISWCISAIWAKYVNREYWMEHLTPFGKMTMCWCYWLKMMIVQKNEKSTPTWIAYWPKLFGVNKNCWHNNLFLYQVRIERTASNYFLLFRISIILWKPIHYYLASQISCCCSSNCARKCDEMSKLKMALGM